MSEIFISLSQLKYICTALTVELDWSDKHSCDAYTQMCISEG